MQYRDSTVLQNRRAGEPEGTEEAQGFVGSWWAGNSSEASETAATHLASRDLWRQIRE